MKNRSKNDLVVQLLGAAIGGATKTKIMYKAYLSSRQSKAYLKMLVDTGLVTYDDTANLYKTTEKGTKFLALCNQLSTLAIVANKPVAKSA